MKERFLVTCTGGDMNTVNIFKKEDKAKEYMISQIVFALQAEYDDVLDVIYDKDLGLVTEDINELQGIIIAYAEEKGYLSLDNRESELNLPDGSSLKYEIYHISNEKDVEIESISAAIFS